MSKIAIIGAGLSGLTVANLLKDFADITIFEKSRGVGGRMATRRAKPFAFDHGAQFFTAKSDEFKTFIKPMVDANIIQRWDAHFIERDGKNITGEWNWGEEYPHFVGTPGMNAIGKHLAQPLNIKLNVRVGRLKYNEDKWHLNDDQGNDLGSFDWVVCTTPPAQASEILPNHLPCYDQINQLKMQACFSLMLGFEHKIPLSFDATLVHEKDISWISVNSSKPGRNTPFCLLVHSTNNWADKHIDDNQDNVLEYLCEQTSETIGHDVSIASHKAIHGWRYANIAKQHSQTTHLLDINHHIAVCGDWFIQGRVESAFISGYNTANEIKTLLD